MIELVCKHEWKRLSEDMIQCKNCPVKMKAEGNKWVEVKEESIDSKQDLTYTDESGTKMYGYSLHDLEELNKNIVVLHEKVDNNTKEQKMQRIALIGIVAFAALNIYILVWYVIHNDVVGHFLKALAG